MKSIESIGKKFHSITVKELYWIKGFAWAKCDCDCGSQLDVRLNDLRTGNTKSCGCHKELVCKTKDLIHGMTKSPEFNVWQKMKDRCQNPNEKAYINYGGRGISVCQRWLHGEGGKNGFQCFYEDMGPRPQADYQIDRYPNNDGNYEPGNCRWATRQRNGSNKRNNVLLSFNGKTQTQAEWAREIGIRPTTILQRLKKGLPIERVLAPIKKG
jgi:hypothetical protein